MADDLRSRFISGGTQPQSVLPSSEDDSKKQSTRDDGVSGFTFTSSSRRSSSRDSSSLREQFISGAEQPVSTLPTTPTVTVSPSSPTRNVSRVDTTVSQDFVGSNGIITPSTRQERRAARRARFREEFIGEPGRAFTSFGSEALTRFSGGQPETRETAQFLASGTPVERGAALLGSVTAFAAPGRLGVGSAEAALLRSAPRALRFPAALAVGGLEARAVSAGVQRRGTRSAPERFQPFLEQDDVFRTALGAERSAESNFVRRALGGINPNLNRRNIDVFTQSAREQLSAQGLRGQELETGVEALTFRRTTIEPAAAAATTLQAGRFSEIVGRVNVGSAVARNPAILQQGFTGRALSTGRRIAPAGFVEVRGELAGERQRIGSDLPFFEGPRSLLPTVSPVEGRLFPEVRSQSQVGQDIGLGLAGAGVSGVLGGFVGAGGTAPRGARGTAARQTGRVANIVGNIADVSEPFTDILAGTAGQNIVTTRVPTLGLTSATSVRGGTSTVQSFFATTPRSPIIPPSINVPSQPPVLTPSVSPLPSPSVSPTPRPSSRTPVTPVGVPPIIPNVGVPVQPQPVVPTVANVFAAPQVPTTSFVGRFPPPVPLDLNLGGGVGRGRKRGTVFVNELQAALGVVTTTTSTQTPRRKNNGSSKKKKEKKQKSPFESIYGDSSPFNIFSGGVRFV